MTMIETHLPIGIATLSAWMTELNCMNAAFFFFFCTDEKKWRYMLNKCPYAIDWSPSEYVVVAKRCKMLEIIFVCKHEISYNQFKSNTSCACQRAILVFFFFFVFIMKCKQLYDINFQIRFHSIRLQNRDFYLGWCIFFLFNLQIACISEFLSKL